MPITRITKFNMFFSIKVSKYVEHDTLKRLAKKIGTHVAVVHNISSGQCSNSVDKMGSVTQVPQSREMSNSCQKKREKGK